MKYLFFFFISTSVLAQFTLVSPFVEFTSQETIAHSGKTYSLKTDSNFSKSDTSIGEYSLASDAKTNELWKRLELIERDLTVAEKTLKEKGLSINTTSTPLPHEAYFVIKDMRVGKNHPAYRDIENVFSEFQKMKWSLQNGVRLNSKYMLSVIENGKVKSTRKFEIKRIQCTRPYYPTRCKFSPWGSLVLTKRLN